MLAEHLTGFVTPSDPHLHPDGTRIAFVVSRMNFDDDRYDRQIWLWDGAEARPFTHGPADSRPRWSPDGESLASRRASGKEGEHAQVAVMLAGGGEAAVLTSFSLGAAEAEWSPDGTRLAVVGTEYREPDLVDEERTRRPRRVTGPAYRFDTAGWLADRRKNVFLVDAAGGAATALTSGDHRDGGVIWRPDGGAVAFLSARHERADIDPGTQVWEVAATGGEPVGVPGAAYRAAAAISPDRALPYVSLGAGLRRAERIDDALASFGVALSLAPEDEGALRGRAELQAERGRRAEAALDFETLAGVLERAGRLTDAADAARRALELAESRSRRREMERLGGLLRGSGEDRDAVDALDRALRILEAVEAPAEPAVDVAGAAPPPAAPGASRSEEHTSELQS